MDDLSALVVTCKHLHAERDEIITRLQKQKHAAHAMCHRLRTKLRSMELTYRLLFALYTSSEAHCRIMREQFRRQSNQMLDDLASLQV